MIGNMTQWILEALRTNGGWSVFLGVLIEQVIVPIPSPAIIMGAGFILIPADASWAVAFLQASLEIVIPGVVASALGAVGMYYLGHYGGKVFVDKFQKFLGFQWSDVEDIGAHFSRRGEEISLFLLRAAPIVPLSLISLASGVLKIPLGLFIVWSVLGTIVRCYLLAFLGWQMGGKRWSWPTGWTDLKALFLLLLREVWWWESFTFAVG